LTEGEDHKVSERQPSAAGSIRADDVSLSTAAVAVMEFTSDIRETTKLREITYIMSKDAYLWAGVASVIAQHSSIRLAKLPTDIEIYKKLYEIISGYWILGGTLSGNSLIHVEKPSNPLFAKHIYVINDEILRSSVLVEDLLEAFLVPPINYEDLRIDLNANIHQGYEQLLRANLISDPVIEAALGIAILGCLPFSIVKRTRNGNVVYRKLQAALWKYERQKRSGGLTETNVTFEAARIAKALKTGLVAAYHEATKNAGDEPEE
jgi:hypothetical protein